MSKTIFITGATSGFGEACARQFASQGWKLILTGRRQQRLEQLRSELGAQVPVHIAALDVRDQQQVTAAVKALPEAFGTVDVLLNNAGLALGLEPAQRANLEDWETMVDTNIKGVLYCTHALLPRMVERRRGHVITIGSIAGTYPYPGGNTYGATKAFIQQFSLNLRADLLGTAVRVTNIEPGMAAQSEFSLIRFQGDKARADAVYAGCQPLLAADVAEAVWWVANLPEHVNINRLEMMPTCQAFGPLAVAREKF